MSSIVVATSDQAIRYAWKSLGSYGNLSAPRGQGTIETLNWSVTIADPGMLTTNIADRKMVPFIGAVEALQLVGQTSVPDLIQRRAPALHRYTDYGNFDGAYGLRIHGLLPRVVDLLVCDPDTRRAVLPIHSREDLFKNGGTKDVPCTQAIQFLVRGDRLHMRVTMRSNDAWLGLPYDLIQFQVLGLAVSAALDIPMGTYHHAVGSLHLYDQHTEKAKAASANSDFTMLRGQWRPGTMEQISRRAREILDDRLDYDDATALELWLSRSVNHTKDREIH